MIGKTTLIFLLMLNFRDGNTVKSIYFRKCREYAEEISKFSPIVEESETREKRQISTEIPHYDCESQQISVDAQPSGDEPEYSDNDGLTVFFGDFAEQSQFPFMALIGFELNSREAGNDYSKLKVSWACGASLISRNFLLSAAHCTLSTKWGYASWALLGKVDHTNSDSGAGVVRKIIERINHRDYRPGSKYNDISLFRLDQDIQFSKDVRPICLQNVQHVDGMDIFMLGWGATESGKYSESLKYALGNLTTEEECKAEYERQPTLSLTREIDWKTMVCAKGYNKSDTCKGDSGGPLVKSLTVEGVEMMSVVGITSFGQDCSLNKPGVYTRLSNYLPWIVKIVWPTG